MFSAEHPHGMDLENKPVVIKIQSVEVCMIKPIVTRQVLSSSSFFLSSFFHLSENTINKRCDWQLIRDSALSKIDNKWWWKSERDVQGQDKNFLQLLVIYLFFFFFPLVPMSEKLHFGLFYN